MFGAFLSVWVHLRPFCYYTKLDRKRAKLVQLVQKFCHDVLLEFFTTNAPDPRALDPKLMFWCVSSLLGAFGTILILHETRSKMVQIEAINAKVHAAMSF